MIKGMSADKLENCLKSLIPVVRVSDTQFIFGTTVKPFQLNSEKLSVLVGGGAIPLT